MTAPRAGPAPQPAVGAAGLLWTDRWYLLAACAALAVVVDPLDLRLAAIPVIKHLALALALPACVLTVLGYRLRRPLPAAVRYRKVLSVFLPLLSLAAFVLAGSLYARAVEGIQNTFLNVGLYMLAAPLACAMVLHARAPERLVRGYVHIILAGAVVMSVALVVNFGVRQVYHEQIFLVVPLAVLFLSGPKPTMLRWAAGAWFLAMAWFSAKYTSYLIAGLTAGYLFVAVLIPRLARRPARERAAWVYWAGLIAIAGAALLAFIASRGSYRLPTGNVEFRLHTYSAAWERFLDSPLWGTAFAVEAVEKFTPYAIGIARNVLPTHSDVLDIVANGGLIAAGLCVWALVALFRRARAGPLAPAQLDDSWSPCAHTLAVIAAAGGATAAFNPILLQPSMAYLIWTSLGLLTGLALRLPAPRGAGAEHPALSTKGRTAPTRVGA
jgi:hypothetical protein